MKTVKATCCNTEIVVMTIEQRGATAFTELHHKSDEGIGIAVDRYEELFQKCLPRKQNDSLD